MTAIPPALPHGDIEEVFADIFFVTGTMHSRIDGADWQFSRNMTIVRDGIHLTLINAIRLDDDGLAMLNALGQVANVVKIGSLHGLDDAFYLDTYGAKFWALPGMTHTHSLPVYKELTSDGDKPFPDCSVLEIPSSRFPECILRADRDGGVLIACDALHNWTEPDEFICEETRVRMDAMGFFRKANIGPGWLRINEPDGSDFFRLQGLKYRHALCGHGQPLRETAHEDYAATFEQIFGDTGIVN